jgi:F-type H+-transporting ATPase subunit gamma
MFQVLHSLASRTEEGAHPILEHREVENILILLITSDKGLCAGFNANLIKRTNALIHENEGKGIFMSVLGKKGVAAYSEKNIVMQKTYTDYFRDINYDFAAGVTQDVIETFMTGKVDKVYLVYNKFKSVISQEMTVKPLLPIETERRKGRISESESDIGMDVLLDYIYEPSVDAILSDILNKYVEVEVYQALQESWASENGARMAAMDSATRNAGDMIDKLTLKYNRARQAAITTEIIEIVSGADALDG